MKENKQTKLPYTTSQKKLSDFYFCDISGPLYRF